ncbi:Hydantoinase B/oxoprolinase, partial [Auricularia subglabra TFB-10046 SS5]
QTAISTSIKERLVFSCALFAPDGDLVANAPFIPIHLGFMSWAVNHLPDITLITPVFAPNDDTKIIFFTASRGHHADIGGILPGSMPPTSTSIYEEGVSIVSFKIVKKGNFDRDGLYDRMVVRPAQYEGSSGCRCFRDVESDLRASTCTRSNAEQSVRSFLRSVAETCGTTLKSIDYLGDGSPIALRVNIDPKSGSATCGAPISVVHSAVIYCMRAMLNSDIPLNAGCLVPVKVVNSPNSLLAPSPSAAVCGGNVLTIQHIVDVVLRAFDACSASQGCINNLTFGAGGKSADGSVTAGWGYYDTIAGGSGAGEGWHGTSGVHTHITNTRIGDVEILERRYPVILHTFGPRAGSGGAGKWRGGDDVRRELEICMPMRRRMSILSERHTRAPHGLHGGGDGALGRNTWVKRLREADGDAIHAASGTNTASEGPLGKTPDELELDDIPVPNRGTREINIGGKATLWMGTGDRLVIETPGG